jgi:hypothetical protein
MKKPPAKVAFLILAAYFTLEAAIEAMQSLML